MATSKKVQVTIEFPEEIAKLSKEEANRMQEMFKSQTANILSGKVQESLLTTIIRNTKPTPGTGGVLSLSKKSGKKSGKKSAKKSSKKR